MLIHQQDFLVIDLEKSNNLYYHGDIQGQGFNLFFTLQINGKLKRSKLDFEVLSRDDFMKVHNLKKDGTQPISDLKYQINRYDGIYAIFNMLDDLGYPLKKDMFDNYYNLIEQIQQGVISMMDRSHSGQSVLDCE